MADKPPVEKSQAKKLAQPQAKTEPAKTLGITAKKEEDFGEWFSQVINRAELIEYTEVSGCYVFRPASFEMWEKTRSFLDAEFKRRGVRNAYFPLFIPERLMNKEKSHIAGFTPEVAWVTHSGETKLAERLAVRPTSETIMYESFKKWIRSWRDLPLLINQWCNIVRWEFKNPVPFIRSREFLWQEGHTVHATEECAKKETFEILDLYEKAYKELYAIPVIKGIKSDSEKFAGALYTTSCEVFLPNGKAAQGCTSHALGQNFAKAFDITFIDKDEQKKHPWQNSWGFTTRTLGLMIMMHSDNKGLVLPPSIAPLQAVIVPIMFDDSKERVLKEAAKIRDALAPDCSVMLDDRAEYTPGWKFNEWEMKGVPLRIEIGPKDIDKGQAVMARRDTGKKEFIPLSEIAARAADALCAMQKDLYDKALEHRKANTVTVKDIPELQKAIKEEKLARAAWCNDEKCETSIKDKVEGAKIICLPLGEKVNAGESCALCGK